MAHAPTIQILMSFITAIAAILNPTEHVGAPSPALLQVPSLSLPLSFSNRRPLSLVPASQQSLEAYCLYRLTLHNRLLCSVRSTSRVADLATPRIRHIFLTEQVFFDNFFLATVGSDPPTPPSLLSTFSPKKLSNVSMSRLDSPVSPQSPSGVTLPVVSSMAGNNVDNSTSPGSQVEAVPPLPSSRASSPELTAALPASQRRSAVSVALTSTSAQGESVAAAQPSSDANDEPDYGLLESVGSTDRPWLETMLDSARRERFGPPVSNTVVSLLDIPRPPSPRTARSMSPTRLLALSRQYADLARTAFRAREDSHRPHSDEIRAQPRLASRRGHGEPHPVVLTAGGTSSELGSDAEQVAVVNPEGQDGSYASAFAVKRSGSERADESSRKSARPTAPGIIVPGSPLEAVIRASSYLEQTPISSDAFDRQSGIGPTPASASGTNRSMSSSVGARRHSLSSRKVKKSKMTLKPIPPTPYDGSPDPEAYMQFVYEAKIYLRLGRVSVDDEVMMISYRLTGKAKKFYKNKVSRDASKWTLQQFFVELFNHCFPLDLCLQQRERLDNCLQNDKSVAEHVLEFEESYLMIGLPDDQEKIVKLFLSFDPDVQKEMYRQGIDPETSSWDKVVEAAEHGDFILNHKDQSSDEDAANSDNERDSSHGSDSECDDGSNSENDSEAESVEGSENKYEDDSPNEDNGYWSPSQLSNSTRRRLLAEGRCFICERRGHIARNCPTWEDSEWENEDSSEPERDPDPDSSVVRALHL
ncbi:hypothetical protein DFH06DRAFT_1344403 [Mycena polygramma]|nr:hypothetical protein DFH06DRAFT_1344403 [Mycena polygramma]